MLKELATSFKAILYDRIVSPLSGAFIVSWLVFNWKIIVLLILGETPILDRIKFIEDNYLSEKSLLISPILSTLFLIIVYPWLSNIAYWIWQKALSFKVNTRIKFENSSPLTLEQSIELRKEIQRKDREFVELLSDKNEKIKSLDENINFLNGLLNEKEKDLLQLKNKQDQNTIPNIKQSDNNDDNVNIWTREFHDRISRGPYLHDNFRAVMDTILGKSRQPLTDSVLRYFISADLVDLDDMNGKISLTKKGKHFANLWTIENE